MRRSCFALAGILMLMPVVVEAQLARLTVTVRGLEPATGTLEVSLFNSADSFFKQPALQRSKPADGHEELSVEFAGLAAGDYAIVVVHDQNDNGALDTGFLGFGGERFGYSNHATSWFGRPSFDAARFTVGSENLDIVIDLN